MIAIGVLIGAPVLWLLAVAWIARRRRPPRVAPSEAVPELPPESPAVANLLTHDFVLTPEALAATLIDLSARGEVDVIEVGPDRYLCKLEADDANRLTAYERRVVTLLEERSVEGVVPAEALRTGRDDRAAEWSDAFTADVVAEAHDHGLTRDRWDNTTTIVLGIAIVALVGGWVLTWTTAPWADLGPAWVAAASAIGLVGVFAISIVEERLVVSRRQIPTELGVRAARRCLAIRRWLDEDETFEFLPAPSVALWDRYLAYAAALGIAPAACRGLPMCTETTRWAWSGASGRWRRVRLHYPRGWPPMWGRDPRIALLVGIGASALAIVTLAFSARGGLGDIGPLVVVIASALLAWSAWITFQAIADLLAPPRRSPAG